MFTDSTLILQKYIRIYVFWLHINENFRNAQRPRSKTVTIWLYSRRRREKFFTFGFPRSQIRASWQSWETEHIFVGQKVGGLKDTLAPPLWKVGGTIAPLAPPAPTPMSSTCKKQATVLVPVFDGLEVLYWSRCYRTIEGYYFTEVRVTFYGVNF